MLDRLKAQYDTCYELSGDEFNRDDLLDTPVIALDELPGDRPLRLEDIPMQRLAEMRIPEPGDQLVEKVEAVLRDAKVAAQAGADAAYETARKNTQGQVLNALARQGRVAETVEHHHRILNDHGRHSLRAPRARYRLTTKDAEPTGEIM